MVSTSGANDDLGECGTVVLIVVGGHAPEDLEMPACLARSLSEPVPDGECYRACPWYTKMKHIDGCACASLGHAQ